MQIFLLSDYDALINTNGVDIELNSGCITKVPESKLYKVYPIGNRHLLPYCIDVSEKGYIYNDNKLIRLERILIREDTEVVNKKIGLTNVEIVCNAFTSVTITEPNITYKKTIPYPLYDVKIKKISNCIIIVAKYCNRRYCLIYNNGTDLYCDIIDDYAINNEELIMLKNYVDMAKQGLLIKYNLNTLISDNELIYFERPYITHNSKLIPFALLEAIKAKNIKLSRKYLSDELNEKLDDEHLIEFFGEYDEVIQNVFTDNMAYSAATINNINRTLIIYSFVIENDKIINIDKN